MKKLFLLIALSACATCYCQQRSPEELYPVLFRYVQTERIFADSKTFADAIPLADTRTIRNAFAADVVKPDFKLDSFVKRWFRQPPTQSSDYKSDSSKDLLAHINSLWPVLTRPADSGSAGSLLPLPHRYVVPGGRFQELYYWDSYFTMLGLEQAGKIDMMEDMVANFAYLIDKFGHIPNGTRSYYLSRSQPPFFALMVALLDKHRPGTLQKYLPEMRREYDYWMSGAAFIKPGSAAAHLVMLKDSVLLNRYWDAADRPREEAFAEDMATAGSTSRDARETYRDIRAAAESGWDFSSRWLADTNHLYTIQTTNIIPVDLNCLLYQLEELIMEGSKLSGDSANTKWFRKKAIRRKNAIITYCWDERSGCYRDYNWKTKRLNGPPTIATTFPLFLGVADKKQAAKVADLIRKRFLAANGVTTTLVNTGQQWDKPNGWAPLQYVTVTGLENYRHDSLAKEIATRWIRTVNTVYKSTGKLMEKYDVDNPAAAGGGGEYPAQDGFGWTNGVTSAFIAKYGLE
ncbi:MAG: alpha,alpha-trehalase TreF [Taibaiella sp.]|nr:alpha,alpha-trehalase TreF [Taibaiella sp.]